MSDTGKKCAHGVELIQVFRPTGRVGLNDVKRCIVELETCKRIYKEFSFPRGSSKFKFKRDFSPLLRKNVLINVSCTENGEETIVFDFRTSK